eukprot:CAMPEP_0167740068 /NCGR_PEP_ID=MMETSP0110_2-20121227/69_1 /TAXON_ID=629695 /ORGANISM="Gymnochlora sp., Strain CCMP2014" /LENGTH=458 /DNA_ID=CAMNT_0007623915 /DNA_START=311 /DNA_END=1687 /DNA_ORIENTATION=-
MSIRIYETAIQSVKPNRMLLLAAIDAYGRLGDYEKVIQTFEEYETHAPRDLDAFNTTVLALSKSNSADHAAYAINIFNEIESLNLIPDINSYYGALQVCSTHARWKDALTFLKEMEEIGIPPDRTTMILALKSCSHGQKEVGKHQTAQLIFDSMESKGIVRDEAAYEPLILSLEIAGEWTPAIDKFNEIPKRGLMWTNGIYNSVMRMLSRMRLFDAGQDLFDKMPSTGLTPDADSYAALFLNCKRAAEFKRAEKGIEEANKQGIEMSVSMLEALCECASKNGLKDKAIEFLNELRHGMKVTPSVSAYSAVLEVCGNLRDAENVELLYKELNGQDLEPLAYDTLIYALGRCGKVDEAKKVFSKMKSIGITPKVSTYNMLICAAGESKEPQLAIDLFDAMPTEGIDRDHETYARMMEALKGTKYDEDMFCVFKDLQNGLTTDTFKEIVKRQKVDTLEVGQ